MSHPEHQEPPSKRLPACPLCAGQAFDRHEGRLDSKWGFTSHRVVMLVCQRCKYILQFYNGNSVWDFD